MSHRVPHKGYLTPAHEVQFTFDGSVYRGFSGDTLSSALLANGVHLMGRSFKYHRPRGIMSSGVDEPNALVGIRRAGGRTTPNIRASTQEIFDGMEAVSQNRFPSLTFDVGGINNFLSRFFPAGFYYKTFMWPRRAWKSLYEPLIRRAAGLGAAPREPDPDTYGNQFVHCDTLIVGGGASGLSAALSCAVRGESVILCDENDRFGGWLLSESETTIDGKPAPDFVADIVSQLASHSNVRLLSRTTAFGYFQQNMVCLAERVADHLAIPTGVRERLWQVRANRVLLAQGSLERPMVFPDNDRPGIMLSGSAQVYLNKYGVAVGSRVGVYTACDSAYQSAFDLHNAGCEVALIVDYRHSVSESLLSRASSLGISVRLHSCISATSGKFRVRSMTVSSRDDARAETEEIMVDCLLMSGGWTPCLHLHCQSRGKIEWDGITQRFLPGETPQNCQSIGSCSGLIDLSEVLTTSSKAGGKSKKYKVKDSVSLEGGMNGAGSPNAFSGKSFVDFQNDVTAKDISLAVQEGMHSIEHIKRYTTNGMATDQGKLSNLHALAIAAECLSRPIPDVGLTMFRPPYTPTTFATFVHHSSGSLFDARRITAIDSFARESGASFEPVGNWDRAWFFPTSGESMEESVLRECRTVRSCAGMFDASTLGKIEVTGPDASKFLDILYTNGGWQKLSVGRAKYGIMLREDGFIYDDGVVACLAPDRYHVTTTTGGAPRVLHHMEDYLQTEFPKLKVWLTSITEQWGVIAIQGPKSREIIEPFVAGVDIGKDSFSHMSVALCEVCGIPARLFRVSFTGELGFEINVPADYAESVWRTIWQRAEGLGACMYGTEAMHVLRAEKGYIIVGQDTDGTVTPHDAGLSWAVSTKKPDFVGKRGLLRPDLTGENPDAKPRRQLVGLELIDDTSVLPEGAQIVSDSQFEVPVKMLGFVTSSYYSSVLDSPFAMALIESGFDRMGETLYVPLEDRVVSVRVRDTIFYDPSGDRLHD